MSFPDSIHPKVADFFRKTESELSDAYSEIDAVSVSVTERVLNSFRKNRVSAMHFYPSTGYGYDDAARDKLDLVYADALQTEKAIVSPQIASGTHALSLMLYGISKPGDRILIASGTPYDTIHDVFGIGNTILPHSLASLSIATTVLSLKDDRIDLEGLEEKLKTCDPSIIYLQRSRGYSWRNALSLDEIEETVKTIRKHLPNVIIALDNCYGEFTQKIEPSALGIDIMAGSLIKNPGGGLAPTGGYIAGKADLVRLVADRMTVPGIGREIGSYAGSYIPFYQGLFLAPHVVAQSKKTAVLIAAVFEKLGFETLPSKSALRNDIVQSVRFNTAEQMISFCKSVQSFSPVDSYVTPEPSDMPGYSDKVIMAAGTFIQGSSIEWSADGPIRPPYTCYIQGGLTYEHGKIAFSHAVVDLYRNGLITL